MSRISCGAGGSEHLAGLERRPRGGTVAVPWLADVACAGRAAALGPGTFLLHELLWGGCSEGGGAPDLPWHFFIPMEMDGGSRAEGREFCPRSVTNAPCLPLHRSTPTRDTVFGALSQESTTKSRCCTFYKNTSESTSLCKLDTDSSPAPCPPAPWQRPTQSTRG